MKLRVTLKDPDGFYECVNEGVKDEVKRIEGLTDREREAVTKERTAETWKCLEKWVEYNEYVEIEFDTEAGTAIVVERAQ